MGWLALVAIVPCLGLIAFILCLVQRSAIHELKRRQNALEQLLRETRAGLADLSAALRTAKRETPQEKAVSRPDADSQFVSRPIPAEQPKPMAMATKTAVVIPPPVPAAIEIPEPAQSTAIEPAATVKVPTTMEEKKPSVVLPAVAPEERAKESETPVAPEIPVAARRESESDWESRIGKRWLTWGGVLLLTAAVGFLIKYAYEQGWIGPWAQVGVGMAAGCALCILGDWQIRQNMRPLGQGILSLGLILIYLTSFGAFALFLPGMVSQVSALCLLGATSVVGVLLANRHDSMPICILSALGGYLAPMLVATGRPPPVNGFFSYTLLINLGVVSVAILRSWPAIPLLALAGCTAHFGGWYVKFYDPAQMGLNVTAAVWACIFHFTFLILPALPIIKGGRDGVWQWLLPPLNAILAVWVVWTQLRDDHPLVLMLALAAMALVHAGIGLWNRSAAAVATAKSVYLALGLAILTVAPPAYFGMRANLVCWLALGLILADMSFRLRFRLFRIFAWINLTTGAIWVFHKFCPIPPYQLDSLYSFLMPFPDSRHLDRFGGGVGEYLDSLFGMHVFWTRLLLPLALGICAAILHRWRGIAPRRNVGGKLFFAASSLFTLILFLHLDISPWSYLAAPAGRGLYVRALWLVPLWSLGVIAMAGIAWKWKRPPWACLSVLFVYPAAVMGLHDIVFNQSLPAGGFFLNAGHLTATFFALAVMFAAWVAGGGRPIYAGLAGYLFVLVQHMELWRCLKQGGADRYEVQCALALLWVVAAILYIVLGKLRKSVALSRCLAGPLAVAAVYAVFLHAQPYDLPPFQNMRYAAGFVVCLAVFAAAWPENANRVWLACAGGLAFLVVNHLEIRHWLEKPYGQFPEMLDAYFGYTALWTLGAVIFMAIARFKTKPAALHSALAALAVGIIVMLYQYEWPYDVSYWLFINRRFFVSAAMLFALLGCGILTLRWNRDNKDAAVPFLPPNLGTAMCVVAAFLGLIVMTVECVQWCRFTYGDGSVGRKAAQMSVSVVWALYAAALLTVGFVTRRRGWRLAGLVLFALTGVKLVFVDLAHLDQLYRILSFLALGLLLIAASYLYHKLEKRLTAGAEEREEESR